MSSAAPLEMLSLSKGFNLSSARQAPRTWRSRALNHGKIPVSTSLRSSNRSPSDSSWRTSLSLAVNPPAVLLSDDSNPSISLGSSEESPPMGRSELSGLLLFPKPSFFGATIASVERKRIETLISFFCAEKTNLRSCGSKKMYKLWKYDGLILGCRRRSCV